MGSAFAAMIKVSAVNYKYNQSESPKTWYESTPTSVVAQSASWTMKEQPWWHLRSITLALVLDSEKIISRTWAA